MLIETTANSLLNNKPESLYVATHRGVVVDFNHSQVFLFGEVNMKKCKRRRKDAAPLCACGCGERVKWNKRKKKWNKFIHRHNLKGKNNPSYGKDKYAKEKVKEAPLCACGCDERVKWCKIRNQWNRFINKHQNSRDNSPLKRPETRKKMSLVKKGKYLRKNNSNWKGGFTINKKGIKLINVPNRGQIPESRLICEKVLGRYLKPHEIVHHIDENPSNNSNNNLLICDKSYHLFLHIRMNPENYRGIKKPVIVDSVEYPSLRAAHKKSGYGVFIIKKRIFQNIKGYTFLPKEK